MLKFQEELRVIYQRQNKIVRLIQGLEVDIPEQPLEEYYVNIKLFTRQGQDKQKFDLPDLQTIFDPLPKEKMAGKRAIHKLLIIGGAGTGKSTLMQYMVYQWSKGELWSDQFDYVYRVSLKTLLNRNWDHNSGRQDESDDLLKRLVHFHLLAELTSEEKQRWKLEDIPWKQKKTLLLLDGFDEVAHEMNGVYRTVFEDIFDHENLILTSRPNAVSREMAGRFGRKIENVGFDDPGINQYLTKYFEADKKKGQVLEDYLRKNFFLKEVCHTPVIIAMLCFIWSEGDSNQAFQKVSNMSDLYHRMVDHLGFRCYAKQPEVSEHELLYKWRGEKNRLDELRVLQHVAYKGMTGGGIEVSDNQRSEALIIPGIATRGDTFGISIQSSINCLSNELRRDMPTINKVYKYGLLKPEGILTSKKEPSDTDLQSHNFSFIHLSFQEFLTARYLAEKLINNQDQENIANFIARHRNEPRYLNTLKFMAGIFSTSEGDNAEQSIKIFWDAIMCNPDGILEFGEELKVILLMHLLSQVFKEDKRIPNMEVAVRLIDSVVLRDLPGWSSQLRESDYLSNNMKDALMQSFLSKNNNQLVLDVTVGEMLEIISVTIHKFSKEQQHQIFSKVFEIFKTSQVTDWQCTKKSIEAIIEINRKVDLHLDMDNQKQLASLLLRTVFDNNFNQTSSKAIKELAQKHQNSLFAEILKDLLKEEFAKLNVAIDETKLMRIADLIRVASIEDNQLIENITNNLIPLLYSSLWNQRESALDKITELTKIGFKNDTQLVKNIFHRLALVSKDNCWSLKTLILEKMTELTKIGWKSDFKLIRETLSCFHQFLKDPSWLVSQSTLDDMGKLTKLGWKNDPQLIRSTLDSFISVLKEDSKTLGIARVEDNIIELVRIGYMDDTQLIRDTLNNLAPLLENHNEYLKGKVSNVIIELIEMGGINDTLFFKKILACLSSLYEAADYKSFISQKIRRFLKISCKDNTQLSRDFLKHQASLYKNYDSIGRRAWPIIVSELINLSESSFNQLTRDLLNIFIRLLVSSCSSVRETASNCIIQLTEINEENEVQLIKNVLDSFTPLLVSSCNLGREIASDCIRQLTEINDENEVQLVKNVLNSFIPLLENPDVSIRNQVLNTIAEFIEKNGNAGLQLAGDILKNSDWDIRYIVSKAKENLNKIRSNDDQQITCSLDKLHEQIKNYDLHLRKSGSGNIKALMEMDENTEARMFSDLLEVLTPFLNHSCASVKVSASETITTLLKMSGYHDKSMLINLFEALKSTLKDTDAIQRGSAFIDFINLLKTTNFNSELVEYCWDELTPFLRNYKKEEQFLVLEILIPFLWFIPRDDIFFERFGDILDSLNPLLQGSSVEIQSTAFSYLDWLLFICFGETEHMNPLYKLLKDFFHLRTHPHSDMRQLASSSIIELVKLKPQDEIEFVTKTLNKFKPLFQDQSIEIDSTVFSVILNLGKIYGVSDAQIVRLALIRLVPLLKVSKLNVQRSALKYMTELTKINWKDDTQLIRETLNILIPYLKDPNSYLRDLISSKVIELAMFGQEKGAQLIRDIFNSLTELLNESDRAVQTVYSNCMTELVRIGSEKDTQLITYALDSLTQLFQGPDCYIKEPVSSILIEIMSISPQFDRTELSQTLFLFLASLLEDSTSSASNDLIKLMKLNKKIQTSLARDAIEISIGLLQHSDQNNSYTFSNFLENIFLQVLLRNPTDLIEYFNHSSKELRDILISGLFNCLENYVQSFELMKQFFKDPKSSLTDRTIQEKLFNKMISQDIHINLKKLKDENLSKTEFSEYLSQLKSLLFSELNKIEVLKGPQIIELAMVIIGKEKMPEDDSDHKKLIETANGVLNIQINYLNDDGFRWIHDNHEKLISLPSETTKFFDRKVCQKLLEHEKMTPLEEGLLIKFIKQGLKTSLTRDGEIIFEGKHHKLQSDNIQQTLEKIAKTILEQQQDLLTLQYKEHKPIFVKSNEQGGMKEAAVDIPDVRSIADKRFRVQNNFWLLTILNSSNSNLRILEKRTVFGDHFLYHLTTQKSPVIFYPNKIPELKDIFGSYVQGEVFQGQVFELTDEVGQQLFESKDPTQIYKIQGRLLSQQKYFQQDLLDEGCEDRNKCVEQELATKLNDYRTILEDQLKHLNSETQRKSIREYYDGFVSTFSVAFESSQVIVAGGVAIDTGTDYFNLVSLFVQLSSLDPFGIAPIVAEGFDSIKRHLKSVEIKNKALCISEIATNPLEFSDLICRIALDSIWQQGYTFIIFTARDDDPANHGLERIKQFVVRKFEELKKKTKNYQCLRNVFLDEIKRTPAFKLGVNDANIIMRQWIQLNQSPAYIPMGSAQKHQKIAEIARFNISQKLIPVFGSHRQQNPVANNGQYNTPIKNRNLQQIPVVNNNRLFNSHHK